MCPTSCGALRSWGILCRKAWSMHTWYVPEPCMRCLLWLLLVKLPFMLLSSCCDQSCQLFAAAAAAAADAAVFTHPPCEHAMPIIFLRRLRRPGCSRSLMSMTLWTCHLTSKLGHSASFMTYNVLRNQMRGLVTLQTLCRLGFGRFWMTLTLWTYRTLCGRSIITTATPMLNPWMLALPPCLLSLTVLSLL